jgi:hypothetical protein
MLFSIALILFSSSAILSFLLLLGFVSFFDPFLAMELSWLCCGKIIKSHNAGTKGWKYAFLNNYQCFALQKKLLKYGF